MNAFVTVHRLFYFAEFKMEENQLRKLTDKLWSFGFSLFLRTIWSIYYKFIHSLLSAVVVLSRFDCFIYCYIINLTQLHKI